MSREQISKHQVYRVAAAAKIGAKVEVLSMRPPRVRIDGALYRFWRTGTGRQQELHFEKIEKVPSGDHG